MASCVLLIHSLPSPASAQSDTVRRKQIQRLGPLGLERLMDIGVTSLTGQKSTVGQSPAAIAVITSDEIHRSGATTIAELLRQVPGMDVARIDANKWSISARGFNDRFANKLLVQIDGRSVYNPLFSGVYWDILDYPLGDIERIEVIRSPGGTIWGVNAVNGIVNIITKPAGQTQGGYLTLGDGVNERGFGTFRYGDTLSDNMYYRAFVKGFDHNPQYSERIDAHDRWWNATLGARVDWVSTKHSGGTIDAGYTRSIAGRSDIRPIKTPPYLVSNMEDEVSEAGHVLVRMAGEAGDSSNWSAQGVWDGLRREGTNGYLDIRYDQYALGFQHLFMLDSRDQVNYGLDYRFIDAYLGPSKNDHGFAISFSQRFRRQQIGSIFAQDILTLIPSRLQLMLGARLESVDFINVETQPVARLLWTPPHRQAVWFAVSRAVRTPNIAEEGLNITLVPRPLPSPPNYWGSIVFPQIRAANSIRNEGLISGEFGYRAQPHDRLTSDISVFYNFYDDLRAFSIGQREGTADSTIFIVPLWIVNGMDGESFGTEVTLQWQAASALRLYGSYSYIDTKLYRRENVPPSAEASAGVSPHNKVYLQTSWNPSTDWDIDVLGRYIGRINGLNPERLTGSPDAIDDYFSLDARAAWRPQKNLELSATGQNLLNAHHPESTGNEVLETPLIEILRNAYVKVTVWF